MRVSASRLSDRPILSARTHKRIGPNINGPSLVHCPPWVREPLARYYLYFSHHRGDSIRLAYARDLAGPWKVYERGVLDLSNSMFPEAGQLNPDHAVVDAQYFYAHIASPDIQVLADERVVRLYYHGLCPDGRQATRVAVSANGIDFGARPDIVGPAYLRTFRFAGVWYGIAMPGELLYSRDGIEPFERIGSVLPDESRHCAVLRDDDRLHVVWSTVGEAPECLYHGTVDLLASPENWRVTGQEEILRPARVWEGSLCPRVPSAYGAADTLVNEVRDPYLFRDGNNIYVVYVGGGESGIGIAVLKKHRSGS